jgi:hypothetical protein
MAGSVGIAVMAVGLGAWPTVALNLAWLGIAGTAILRLRARPTPRRESR